MTLVLGIDPGFKGAIAVFDVADRRVSVVDMPDTTTALHDAVSALPAIKICILEKPYYPKIIGTRNVARIAEAYGKILSALTWRGIPIHQVAPKDWKASMNLSSAKADSRERASQVFPDDADLWKLAKHDGRAEAALLAWYGLRFAK